MKAQLSGVDPIVLQYALHVRLLGTYWGHVHGSCLAEIGGLVWHPVWRLCHDQLGCFCPARLRKNGATQLDPQHYVSTRLYQELATSCLPPTSRHTTQVFTIWVWSTELAPLCTRWCSPEGVVSSSCRYWVRTTACRPAYMGGLTTQTVWSMLKLEIIPICTNRMVVVSFTD